MKSNQNTQTLILQTSQEYEGLLDQMEQMTCELMAAIQAWDAEKVHDLISLRSDLCDKIGEKIHLLTSLDPVTQLGKDPSESPLYTRLEETIQRIYVRQQDMLSKQAETERAVTAELQRRGPALAVMTDRRGKQNAYRKTGTAPRQPRFLDSKT
jgi:hypothetical protein